MITIKRSGILFLFALSASPTSANDSVAVIQGQNLELSKSNDIEMLSEDLAVSLGEVSVKYNFQNKSKKHISSLVTFPLDDFFAEVNYGIDITEWLTKKDPLNFKLKVDSKAVPVKIDVKKIAEDPKAAANEKFQFDKLKVQYYWEQNFPASKKIEVYHQYKPGIGRYSSTDEESAQMYCYDESFKASLKKLRAKVSQFMKKSRPDLKEKADQDSYIESYLHFNSFKHFSYIVKTANNWAGPIKDFRLIIKKPNPQTLVSTCWTGLKKINPLEFEFKAQNFVPERDLNIVFMNFDVR